MVLRQGRKFSEFLIRVVVWLNQQVQHLLVRWFGEKRSSIRTATQGRHLRRRTSW